MISETPVKSILRKSRKHIDNWFCASYGLAPYNGCQHACAYCDGRFEKYASIGEFGIDVGIRTNAPELLAKQIKTIKEPGYIMIGSGITDAFQPIEQQYHLTRQCLEIVLNTNLGFPTPVHILTKGVVVDQSLELIAKIAHKHGAILSYSIAMDDPSIKDLLEPRTAPLERRYATLKKAKQLGINTGIMMIPLIPFLSDTDKHIEGIYQQAYEAKVDFLMFGGMTLKIGRQKDYFLHHIKQNRPELLKPIEQLYSNQDEWGSPPAAYSDQLMQRCYRFAKQYRIPMRIPQRLLTGKVPTYVEAAMLLAHCGDYLRYENNSAKGLSYAGYQLQQWMYEQKKGKNRSKKFNYHTYEQLFANKIRSGELQKLRGITPFALQLLQEYLDTGSMKFYQALECYETLAATASGKGYKTR
jgi:DNA repair photolyase